MPGQHHLLHYFNVSTAAMFSVPAMATVEEGDQSLVVCVTMTTTPPGGLVENEVTLSLATTDGTGESC